MLQIYNTLSKKEELFLPNHQNIVKLFVCGPTTYAESHIGHARTYIAFDAIVRYLKYLGYTVFYLQNITDIDDKIIDKAKIQSKNPDLLSKHYEKKYLEDMENLGVNNVNFYARATEHTFEIINQVKILIEKGFAYETENGVYFEVSKFQEFGKLSNQNIEELNVHRVNPDGLKKDVKDFVLWKKVSEKPCWDSPWGFGRPGWHIEDTAITEKYFGPKYDIHGGGLDLIFPHHEAEIAQMESISGEKPMVKYWMHTGFLNVNGTKMSKSLSNFITIKEILEKYNALEFRFFVLSTHYRSPIDFSSENLEASKKSFERITNFIKSTEFFIPILEIEHENDDLVEQNIKFTKEKFFDAMNNDFNTPLAISAIFGYVRFINKHLNDKNISKKSLLKSSELIFELMQVLGFEIKTNLKNDKNAEELLDLILNVRSKLREKKEWEISDYIRNRLNEINIKIDDIK
ncbi:cysteinyl-tRNA synthetase [Methanococcus vannielii SB]|uniref:Cysteine--tRNA ligase n=1 Tax=Methanococcus vannielii (strain ATCC 35089 / DSM 1224 / JCM 13029 / OCM 148 / SB) TaxID=406327 RepID=A6UNK9_METVS|nr:cysteine--tRNA ligase [Methanococcus vannielii]ABR54081.1 cysteinyl-tRNA synthetase [Methanococcus vannielii SB]